jgi:hypothetical protein
LVHQIVCSSCKDEFGILGIRYQCILCEHFNLCSGCEQVVEHEHSLVKVKQPGQAITKGMLLERFKKELVVPAEQPVGMPVGHYVPSISREEAKLLCEAAKDAYEQGLARSKGLMDDLFYKLSVSHKNPYEGIKPAPVVKVETVGQKATYLQNIVGLSYN